MPSDTYPQDHALPHGQMVWGYNGQLTGTDHKFGSHQLTCDCTCNPWTVTTDDGKQTVTHQ
jgi:hypothetical protein